MAVLGVGGSSGLQRRSDMAGHHVDLSQDIRASLVATCVSLLVMTWIAVGLRTYVRVFLTKAFQRDDFLMLVAQALFTVACAFTLAGVTRGLGKHNAAVPVDDQVAALMWQALATALYIADMMFIKLSIGFFLIRLSAGLVYRYLLHGSLVVITLWSLGIFIWDIFQCTPVEKQWDFRIDHGYCASGDDIIAAAYALSVMSILSDWFFALLPIPMLWNVKMTTQAKATVFIILGLGIFASVATLIRLKFLSGLEETDDLMYTATDAMVWTLVEPGVAIVASSLATIRPLLRALRIRGFQSTDRTPSTGISASRRCASNGKATPSMPGYDANGTTLHDVAYGDHLRHEPAGKSEASGRGLDGQRQGDSKSEVYVIEHGKQSPTCSTQDLDPTNRSGEVCRHLEAQSQEDGRLGLGIPRPVMA